MKLRHRQNPRASPPQAWGAKESNEQPPQHNAQPPYQGQGQGPDRRQPPYPEGQAPARRKRHRVFFWFFLAVQVLFIAWIIAGIASSGGTPAECAGLTGNELELCKDAHDVGTTIGVGLIIGIWVAVDFILAVTYGIYRLAQRPPRA